MVASAYTSVSISGYNASPPADDGSKVTSNQLEWDKHETKLSGPVKTLSESVNTNVVTAFGTIHSLYSEMPDAKTANYSIAAADDGVLFRADSSGGAFTFTLLAAATAGAGFRVGFKKIDASVIKVTIDGNSTETIDGATTVDITAQYGVLVIVCDGSNWHTVVENVSPGENYIINGDFRLAQRGTTFDSATTPANSDDNYILDRWILLSDGNDRVDMTQETTTVPAGTYSAIKFDVETVSGTSEKFGILQIIEARDSAPLIGAPSVTLSFTARTTSGAIENVRVYVVAFDTGTFTADAVTSDIISSWPAEGSNPTFITGVTAENTGADIALTNVYQNFIVPNIPIDTSNAVNVGVFLMVDDTDLVATDVFYISKVKLEIGSFATAFVAPLFETELAKSRRFHERRNFDSVSVEAIATAYANTDTEWLAVLQYAEKRTAPVGTGTAAGTFAMQTNNGEATVSGVSFAREGRYSLSVVITSDGTNTGEAGELRRDGTETCFIDIDAEL